MTSLSIGMTVGYTSLLQWWQRLAEEILRSSLCAGTPTAISQIFPGHEDQLCSAVHEFVY